jgi:ribosomal protein S18 acetylase RimI-like enzyme
MTIVLPMAPASEALAIRRLGRHDLPEVERHLLSLGPSDRRKRFLSPFDDGAITRYVAGIDADRAVLVGAEAEADGRLAGIAEAHPVGLGSPRMVEVAVSVHPYHRREGLGRRLAAEAVALAFAEGAEAAVFLFAPENREMAEALRAIGARVTGLGRALLRADAPAALMRAA